MKPGDLFWLAAALTAVVMTAEKGGSRERNMPYHDEYTDDEQNSQLSIFRTLSDEEKLWVGRCERRVAQLLTSLEHEDATRPLFTFFERKAFDIPVNHRPRPKE